MFKLFIKTKWIFNIEPRGKVYFAVKLILIVFTNLFMIIYPILLGYMIDSIFYRNSWKQFINCIFIYTIIFITHQFFNILTEKLNLIIKFNFSNGLKKFFFNRVINAKAIHLSKISSGDLINVINNDSENVHKFYDEIILSTIISSIYILTLFIIIIIFSWEIAFSVLFFSILTVHLADISKKKFKIIKKIYRNQYDKYIGWILEAMNGMQDIRINKAEEITNNIFKDHVLKLLKNKQKARFLEIKAERLNGFFTVLFTLSFWILSAIFVINNKITVGTFFIIEKYFNILINNIDNIKQAKINYHNFQPSFERLLELYNYKCENSEYESNNNRFLIRDCPLLFENVVFHYTKRPIINHLNIKIEKGEFLSIVGANGVGKSTLFGLIIKFFDVKHGCIKLKDYNINDIPTKELRNQIGYVQQNTIIFEGTLEDNLKLYNNKVTKIEMWEVLKQCGLYETIIKWDDGLKTDLMNGDKLSGGQKQRISFARLLIKNPGIILMDEPTSAMDNDMELLIIKDIKRIFAGKTLIMISHRPIPIYAADKIAVLHDGKFIDIGTNIELMERCRIYRQMFSNNYNQSGDKEYVF